MTSIRMLLRLGPAVLLAGSLAGCGATYDVYDSVRYVPGYGYVVSVEKELRKSDLDHRYDTENYYYVFNTDEEAKRFFWTVDADWRAPIAKDHQPRYMEGSPDYGRIACAAGRPSYCARPGAINDAIERVTPPTPTGPAPQ
jgi:hypothetical protein